MLIAARPCVCYFIYLNNAGSQPAHIAYAMKTPLRRNYYIGKTRNYVFVHHENLKTTDVIPMSRVKQITVAQHRPAHKKQD